jgi:MFS family permease
MRRLLVVASVIVFLDVALYAAITPLLPEYVHDLGLSKGQAGLLYAASAIGTMIASLPAGLVAARFGPRRTMIGGLLLLGGSSLVFGFAHHIALLDGARFVQGVSGAFTWSGALSWLITAASDENRGSVIGTALGAAVAGALLGPALGALAGQIGTEPVYAAMLAITVLMSAMAARLPEVRVVDEQGLSEIAAAMLSRPVITGAAFVAVPSLMFGAVGVLVPLRIDELGGGAGLIAGGFIAGAALEAILAPVVGRYSDRNDRKVPFVTGLAICAAAVVFIPVGQGLGVVVAALIGTSLGAGLCYAPATTMLSESAEATGLHQGFAAALSNMAWAAGQMIGALGAGSMAGVVGDAIPSAAIAALLLLTALYARRCPVPVITRLDAGGRERAL